MTASLGDFVTWTPYVWWAAALAFVVVLVALARSYEARWLPRARRALDEHQARHAVRPRPAPIDVTPQRADCPRGDR